MFADMPSRPWASRCRRVTGEEKKQLSSGGGDAGGSTIRNTRPDPGPWRGAWAPLVGAWPRGEIIHDTCATGPPRQQRAGSTAVSPVSTPRERGKAVGGKH